MANDSLNAFSLTKLSQGGLKELLALVTPVFFILFSISALGFLERIWFSHLSTTLLQASLNVTYVLRLFQLPCVALVMKVADWLNQWIESPGILTAEFSFQVALLSNRLPGSLHGDPADRILIATAYQESAVLVTADEKILSYGNNAFISVYNPA